MCVCSTPLPPSRAAIPDDPGRELRTSFIASLRTHCRARLRDQRMPDRGFVDRGTKKLQRTRNFPAQARSAGFPAQTARSSPGKAGRGRGRETRRKDAVVRPSATRGHVRSIAGLPPFGQQARSSNRAPADGSHSRSEHRTRRCDVKPRVLRTPAAPAPDGRRDADRTGSVSRLAFHTYSMHAGRVPMRRNVPAGATAEDPFAAVVARGLSGGHAHRRVPALTGAAPIAGSESRCAASCAKRSQFLQSTVRRPCEHGNHIAHMVGAHHRRVHAKGIR